MDHAAAAAAAYAAAAPPPYTPHPQNLTCTLCNKPISTLRLCASCGNTLYCSTACQKLDSRRHSQSCPKVRRSSTSSSSSTPPPPTSIRYPTDFTTSTYLHPLYCDSVFEILIDTYRLRVEDEFRLLGTLRGVYNTGEKPFADFRRFLDLAEKTEPCILPNWWNKETRRSCERVAKAFGGRCNVHRSVKRVEVEKHYKDGVMPVKLRMLAESVYGGRVAWRERDA